MKRAREAYDTAQVLYRTLNSEGHVMCRQNIYSVPWQRIGELLPVRITEKELIVYGPDEREIARRFADLAHLGTPGDGSAPSAHCRKPARSMAGPAPRGALSGTAAVPAALPKTWMPEDDRMAIFDAVSLAVACFQQKAGAAEPADQAATQIR